MGGHELGHGRDDGARLLVLDIALAAGHDVVGAALKDAPTHGGSALAVGHAGGKGKLDLVAVALGVVHAHDGVDLALEVGEELLDVLLFALELQVVGHGEPLAAAAALGYGTPTLDAALAQLLKAVFAFGTFAAFRVFPVLLGLVGRDGFGAGLGLLGLTGLLSLDGFGLGLKAGVLAGSKAVGRLFVECVAGAFVAVAAHPACGFPDVV